MVKFFFLQLCSPGYFLKSSQCEHHELHRDRGFLLDRFAIFHYQRGQKWLKWGIHNLRPAEQFSSWDFFPVSFSMRRAQRGVSPSEARAPSEARRACHVTGGVRGGSRARSPPLYIKNLRPAAQFSRSNFFPVSFLKAPSAARRSPERSEACLSHNRPSARR